jgi:hypothetical protein
MREGKSCENKKEISAKYSKIKAKTHTRCGRCETCVQYMHTIVGSCITLCDFLFSIKGITHTRILFRK